MLKTLQPAQFLRVFIIKLSLMGVRQMSDPRIDYEAVFQRVDRRMMRMKLFFAHLIGFVGISMFLGATELMETTAGMAVFIIVFLSFIGHAVLLALNEQREKLLREEIALEERKMAMGYEKPKRLSLDEDGELVEMPLDNEEYDAVSRR